MEIKLNTGELDGMICGEIWGKSIFHQVAIMLASSRRKPWL